RRLQFVFDALSIEDCCEQPNVLMDLHCSIDRIMSGNESESSPHFVPAELSLLVTRFQASGLRQNPDLKQMDRFGSGRVELAVSHTGSCAHALNFTRPDDGTGTHAVLMFQGTFKNVRKNFHVAMRVCSKSLGRRYPVLINDAERAKTHVAGVVIPIE